MGRVILVIFSISCLLLANCKRFYLVETDDDSEKILDDYEKGDDYGEEDTDEWEIIAQSVITKELPKREKKLLDGLPKKRQKEIKTIIGKEIVKDGKKAKKGKDYLFCHDCGFSFTKWMMHCVKLFFKILTGGLGAVDKVLVGESPKTQDRVCTMLANDGKSSLCGNIPKGGCQSNCWRQRRK